MAHPRASDSLRDTWEPGVRRDWGYGLRVRTNNGYLYSSVPRGRGNDAWGHTVE